MSTLEVLAPAAVAELLHCSVKTVEEKARAGDLPGLKYGDGWVFPAGALAQRLNELALEQARTRADPPKPSGVLRAIQQGRKQPRSRPVLPDLPAS